MATPMLIDDLRAQMVKRRMNQADLARALGVSQGAVSLWFSGKRRIPDLVSVALRTIPKRTGPRPKIGRPRKKRDGVAA